MNLNNVIESWIGTTLINPFDPTDFQINDSNLT